MMKVLLICLEQQKMKIAVISVTKSGEVIAEKLKHKLDIDLYSKEWIKDFSIKEVAKKAMEEYKAIMFISSTGIAVRAIAEHIKEKDKDPAVLVIDSCSKFVISLLSGHLGGANELTLIVSEILSSTPVITTATDNLGVVAPDMIAKNNDLVIDNLKDAKEIAALLVDKKKVGFVDLKGQIPMPKGYTGEIENVDGLVYVTNNLQEHIDNYFFRDKERNNYEENNIVEDSSEILDEVVGKTKNNGTKQDKSKRVDKLKGKPVLKLIRKSVVLGIGCRKNFNAEEMKQNIKGLLMEKNIDERSIKYIATVEVKKDEEAIIKLSEYFGCELKIFSLEEIKKVHQKYEGSDFVEKTIGVRAVSEPCVELMGARLITDKVKINGMTVCVGEFY